MVVKDADGCTSTITINVNSQLGVDEENKNLISIYPNPAKDQITISTDGSFVYKIVGTNGKIITNGTGLNQECIKNTSTSVGVFFLGFYQR